MKCLHHYKKKRTEDISRRTF